MSGDWTLGRRTDERASEATAKRDQLGGLFGELDRRKREFLDVKGQLRQHPLAAGLLLAGASAVLASTLAGFVMRRRRRRGLGYTLGQIADAGRRIVAHPDRVAPRDPSPWRKVVIAVATSTATTLVTRLSRKHLLRESAH